MTNQDEFINIVGNDTWINYNKNGFVYDVKNHTFDENTFTFAIRHAKDNYPSYLAIYHGNSVIGLELDTHKEQMGMGVAKKLVDSTIDFFNQKQNVKLEDIDKHLQIDEYIENKYDIQQIQNFNILKEGIRDRGSEIMREAAGMMTGIIETGISSVVTHKKYGNITVDAGEAKSRSFGLNHIIKQRHDEGKTTKETAALLILLDGTLKNGVKTRDIKLAQHPENQGRMELDAGGIIAIISKQRKQGDKEQWVLTGFEDKGSKEATDTIQKVISRYGYAPEFLGLEKQVGAVVSSLQISPEFGEKSSGNIDRQIETAQKTGYVQGVCECVATIGDDHALGKKLLTEMNVTKDTAKKYANPETYKTLEKGIFAPKPEQKLEQTQGVKR